MCLGGEVIFQSDKIQAIQAIQAFEPNNSGLFQVAKRAAGNLCGDGIDLPGRDF